MTSARDEILQKISEGYTDSHELANATKYNQQHIQRVVLKLEADGVIIIDRKPRGYTYMINPENVSSQGFKIGDRVCNTDFATKSGGIEFVGKIVEIKHAQLYLDIDGAPDLMVVHESWCERCNKV